MTLLEKLNATDRFAQSIGAQLTEVREGYAKAELTVEERHLNGAGVCQGGVMTLPLQQWQTVTAH